MTVGTPIGKHPAKLQHIRFGDLTVDAYVQRKVIPARVAKFEKSFDPSRAGVLTVSEREDGTLHIVDGQHRWHAAIILGHEDLKARCLVYQGLTIEEEAALFLALNDVRPPSAFDRYRMGVKSKDPEYLGVDEIVHSFGLRVDLQDKDATIACSDEMLRIYRQDPETLKQTLRVLRDAWGTERSAYDRLVVKGVATILDRFNGEVDHEDFAKKLARVGTPSSLLGKAASLADIRPITKSRAMAEIMRDTYNGRRRTGLLPPL